MTFDDSEPSPPARTLGWVWVIAGGVGVVVGVFATVFMIVVFGLVAAALGVGLIAVANLRDKSRRRTARTLSGDPPPPASAPYAAPPPGDEPDPGPDDADGADDADDADDADERSGSREDEAGTDHEEPVRPSEDVSISDVEDGYGNDISEQDRPGRRPGVADDSEGA